MTPQMWAINDATENGWAYALFCFVIIGLFAMTLLLALFSLLALRAVLRFLVYGSMNGVVHSLERRALKSAKP